MSTPPKKKQPPKLRSVQAPKLRASRAVQNQHQRWLIWFGVAALTVAIGISAFALQRDDSKPALAPIRGLPATPDYHSLSVSPRDASRILLGTHQGIFASDDGGRVWRFQALSGHDAMNLARPSSSTLWTAGHNVLAKSTDGGKTWTTVQPRGLPSLDVHGFASDPGSGTLYAAVAGEGLYHSTNGGTSFSLVSQDVGGAVMALAVKSNGSILAGDMQRGLLESRDGGKRWRQILRAQLAGLAINPRDPQRIVATGPGILLSTNGGKTWSQTLKLDQGAGPVAWAASKPNMAYVVGFDQTFYRSDDGGLTWQPVS